MSTNRTSGRPGPIGTSCVTCRRRRKKCDKTRPFCQRCAAGGFTCLGYSCPDEGASTSNIGHSVTVEHLAASGHSVALGNGTSDLCLPHSNLLNPLLRHNRSEPADQFMPIIMLTTRRPPDIPDWPSPPSIPYSPSLMPKDTAQVTTYILTQFEHLIRLSFFQPAYYQFTQFRDAIGCRLQHSDTALWTKYLACKIFESALDGTSQRKMPIYHRSLQNIELRLRSTPDQNLTVAESYNRLAGVLEVAFMKLMFSRGMSAYQLLRDEVPTFLQLVFTDPTLWPDPTNFSSISLARVLASTNYELSRFILLDALHSMALGLPQVIEYDTSTPPLHLGIWPSEWVHGCPIDLQFALVEINKRCNARIRVAPEPDWRPIEDRIKSWKPAVHALSGDDSWKTVATMVVQESWRHTLLIYLYMGVCGVKSDDDRVQASVQQVFQLIGSVDSFQTPSLSIHFLAQYLIAGACARSENQRDIAHKKLASAFHNAVWLIRGSDFVPVLDHLWHGAAANGQPIRWSDYVHSRQVMLPVPS